MVLALASALTPAENALQTVTAWLQERSASGQVHVIEMDAASIATIERWPWPRKHYATVIDRLNAAGVRSIVFDVDFSTPSEPAQDRMLARAIARSRASVILPTFAQRAGFHDGRMLDALPIPLLRQHASLASVSMAPDRDGFVRKMPFGTVTQGVPRPSLAAQTARRSGTAGTGFAIDLAIQPQSIPRHSFIAVVNDRFDRGLLQGKDVLIGATAIEMGDRYAVPRHGVLPGVIVQALATETLYAGVPVAGGWLVLLLAAAPFGLWVLAATRRRMAFVRGMAGSGALLMAQYGAFTGPHIGFEVIPALGTVGFLTGLQMLLLFRRELYNRRLVDLESGLPNGYAMAEAAREQAGGAAYTVAAKIQNFDAVKSVLGQGDVGPLIVRLSDRLRMAGCADVIYRVDDRVLAWTAVMEHYLLEDALTGLRALMRSPVEVGGRRIDVSIAFGIARAGDVAQATHAASIAQRDGLPWCYHKNAERSALEQQLSLMGELDKAISRHELLVLYQPKLALTSGRIASVEALIRWEHPERGFLRPDSFIPLAEQNDRIADLTLYVLRQTIEDVRAWGTQGLALKAAINISARLVSAPSFIAAAEATLVELGPLCESLIFEVTESAAMDNPEAAVEALHLFRKLGVAISMDDYGTGQSSLTYLKTLPLSELKIDGSFVQFAHRDQNDALLVRSTVQLAHELGLQVVAEGVEDEECLDFLRRIECDYAQGYLIGKPMRAADLTTLVVEGERRAA